MSPDSLRIKCRQSALSFRALEFAKRVLAITLGHILGWLEVLNHYQTSHKVPVAAVAKGQNLTKGADWRPRPHWAQNAQLQGV